MATTGNVQAKATLYEVLEAGIDGVSAAAQKTITHSILGASHAIAAATMCQNTKAMDGGAGTLDLTALPGTADTVRDLSGLKVQWAWFRNTATNGNAITITFGASNPYDLLGGGEIIVLEVGQEIAVWGNDATPEIGSSACEIDISGTLAQTLDYLIVAS